jgi:(1->4)-alpha-D-glucan 1-alpha-D-glucosylmutase
VDPDNRRPVDYQRRETLLQDLDRALERESRQAVASRLMDDVRDDRLKLYTTSTLLRFRREHQELFATGTYEPLAFDGARRDHLFGFARRSGDEAALLIVPRLVATLLPDSEMRPLGEHVWSDTSIDVSALIDSRPQLQNALTGTCVEVRRQGGRASVRAADAFAHFPIALLR